MLNGFHTELGSSSSPHKLTRSQIWPIIDKIADKLPLWKLDLLTKAGRKVLVQFVLTPMLIYLVMALDLPSWALKAIDKIIRDFFWKGRKDVSGGHCLIAWPKVTSPPNLGGLGISNLQSCAGLWDWDGFGCKKLNQINLGNSYLSKLHLRSTLSFLKLWCLWSVMARHLLLDWHMTAWSEFWTLFVAPI